MSESRKPSLHPVECRHVVLSGCSGGGKSTLLAELASRGFATVAEPGRRIVAEELLGDGAALPWVDLRAFAKRAIDMAANDRRAVKHLGGRVFFDRGLVDAAAALQHVTGIPALTFLESSERYHQQVFMTPPWPEIFKTDGERRHGLPEAIAEYERLLGVYSDLEYEIVLLPKIGVAERADFVLRHFR